MQNPARWLVPRLLSGWWLCDSGEAVAHHGILMNFMNAHQPEADVLQDF